MITLAKQQYKKSIFIQMDAQKIDLNEKFDIVFSNAAFHWVQDHEAVIQGVVKVLKPNGKIVFQMGGFGNAAVVFKALEITIKKYRQHFQDFRFPYMFHGDEYYKKLLLKYGFEDSDVKLLKKDMIHQDKDTFRRWLETTWFPYTDVLPNSLRETFLEEFMENYLILVPLDEKNRAHVDMVRLEIKSKKGE